MNNQLIALAIKDFSAYFEKQDGRHSCFSDFSLLSFSGCVIATVFKPSGEIRYYKRLLKNMVFGVRVCVCVRSGLVG